MNNCYLCNTSYNKTLLECPKCQLPNFELMTWVPENVKEKYIDKWRIKKTEITPKFIENIFKQILTKYNIKPKRLVVKPGNTPLIEITSHNKEQTNLELIYDPMKLSCFDQDEIESMLFHEAFHPLTSKRAEGIVVPAYDKPDLVDYISDFTVAYEEYINYKENEDYYSESEVFHRIKTKELPNYEIIIHNNKYFISNSMLPTPLTPHQQIIKLFFDLVYFMLVHKDEIITWASKNNVTTLLTLYEWIVADFEYIRRLNPDEKMITDLTRLVGQLVVSVIITEIILGDNLEFTPEAFDMYTMTKKKYDDGNHKHELVIIESWLDRLNSL